MPQATHTNTYTTPRPVHRSGVSSNITFRVGPMRKEFTIPTSVLAQSSAFSRDFPRFRDSIATKLSETDPKDFGNLQKYLHESDIDERVYGNDKSAIWKGLRNVYFLVIEIELDGLKKLIIEKSNAYPSSPDTAPKLPIRMLEMAERVYGRVPAPDKIFRVYFIECLQHYHEYHLSFPKDMEENLVGKGVKHQPRQRVQEPSSPRHPPSLERNRSTEKIRPPKIEVQKPARQPDHANSHRRSTQPATAGDLLLRWPATRLGQRQRRRARQLLPNQKRFYLQYRQTSFNFMEEQIASLEEDVEDLQKKLDDERDAREEEKARLEQENETHPDDFGE
ncbi:MAG: hypothetical protein Q9187_006310 [Circinaria calcarea]